MTLLSARKRPVQVIPLGREVEPNVRVLTDPLGWGPPDTDLPYRVLDGTGTIHETGAGDRHAALRELGRFSLQGTPLPLLLLRADGSPTGDRIG